MRLEIYEIKYDASQIEINNLNEKLWNAVKWELFIKGNTLYIFATFKH